jgi:hypothetical protein
MDGERTERAGAAGAYRPAVPKVLEVLKVLDVLGCEIGARPKGAPTFDDVAGAVRAVRREPGALVVDYDPSAAERLEAVVEAERLCCAGVGWHLERVAPAEGAPGGVVRLRIEASPARLDALGLVIGPLTRGG